MDQDVMYALMIMWKGMLSIFIVIFILTLIVIILTKVTNLPSAKKNEDAK
jgi:Na+-transporting methylmalonyl-CoA/oxaloacetate decarboxylase gamma subunit